MSSGFVSAGTTEVDRDDEWRKAHQEIEENRRRADEEKTQDSGKSLYEVLQANKAAKQEAFEESIKLKNQFRALDEDEVEFLDSVLESTRAKEEAIKKETSEQLELFRKHQEELEKVASVEPDEEDTLGGELWVVGGKKRKRTQEKAGLKGLKIRKSSSTAEILPQGNVESPGSAKSPVKRSQTTHTGPPATAEVAMKTQAPSSAAVKPVPGAAVKPSAGGGLGLAGYSSDED